MPTGRELHRAKNPDLRLEQKESTRQHHRFTPDGKGLIYLRGLDPGEDFWRLDLTTGQTKLLARLGHGTSMSFDMTPDGRQIVFDRVRENSDIVLIDLPN